MLAFGGGQRRSHAPLEAVALLLDGPAHGPGPVREIQPDQPGVHAIRQPHPPFVIGAGGERAALRVAARHATIWNCPARTAAEFRHKSRVLDAHCDAIGRDPAEITRSMQVLVPPGDPAASRALLLELIEAGATHLVLAPVPPWPDRPARWLAEEVAGPVAAQLSPG